MADTKREYLYSVVAENAKLKEDAAAAGIKIKFDQSHGAWHIDAEGMSKKDMDAAKKTLSGYLGEDAKKAWEEDRVKFLAEKAARKELARAAAKERESTTKEAKPERKPAVEETRYLMFPAHSQKAEFRQLVQETGSQSRFVQANANREAHFSVKTEVPEKFAVYMGEEARDRFIREHAERAAKAAEPRGVNTDLEIAREEALKRAAKGFMAQYAERGFRLGDPERNPAEHQKQLNDMRSATNRQLLMVIEKSRAMLAPLREKEVEMRAEAAGLSVEQVKAMSFADQKAVAQVDGKPVGLTGEDFILNAQLSRGISAINAELNARGIRSKNVERTQEREGNEQGQKQAGEKSEKKGYVVDQEQSVENDAIMMAAFDRGRGQGR